jgi:hypothetical protein
METGSASKARLATLGGTAWDPFDVVVFCQPRQVIVSGATVPRTNRTTMSASDMTAHIRDLS